MFVCLYKLPAKRSERLIKRLTRQGFKYLSDNSIAYLGVENDA